MAKPPRIAISGTFFVTTITDQRRRIFQSEAKAQRFIRTLQHYRAQGLYKLFGFVVMPDHVHLLLTTDDLPKAIRHIKAGFSHRLESRFPIWQKGYADHLIEDRGAFNRHLNYLHQNPVRAKLVEQAELFPFSSAYRGIKEEREKEETSI